MEEDTGEGPRVGVALGGGAARGLAHVGVLRGLLEAGVPIHCVGGSSIGALIGALYASSLDVERIEQDLGGFLGSDEFAHMRLGFLREERTSRRGDLFTSVSSLLKKGVVLGYSMTRPSFVTAEEFARHLRLLLPDVCLEDLRLPLVVVAADLNSGREVAIASGPLRDAVGGSCAIPGLLPPIPWGERLLIDGGWVNMVPVRPVRELGADLVIAVDVSRDLEDTHSLRSGLNILTRATAICASRLRELQLQEADFVLRPQVQDIHWADFSRLDDALAAGARVVRERRDALLDLLARRRRRAAVAGFSGTARAG